MNQVKGAMKETETEKGKNERKGTLKQVKKGKEGKSKGFPTKIHSAPCPTISHDHPSTFYCNNK